MYLSYKCQLLSYVLSACIGSASLGADPEEGVLLKAVYRPGDVTYLELNLGLQQKFSNDIMGQLTETDFRQIIGLFVKIVSVNEAGETQLELTFDRAALRVNAMNSLWAYDSDGGQQDIMLKRVMRPLLGKKVTLRIDAAGKPITLEGMIPILEDMELSSVDDPGSAQFFGQIKPDLSDLTQRFLWADMSLGLLPNRRVKVGDTWQVTLRQPLVYVGALSREYICTLEAVEDNAGYKVARIGYQAVCDVAPDAPATFGAWGTPMEYLGGTVTGTLLFDLDNSRIIFQDEQTEATQVAEAPHPDGSEDAQRMTIDQTGRVVLRRLAVDQRAKQKKRHARGPNQPRVRGGPPQLPTAKPPQ